MPYELLDLPEQEQQAESTPAYIGRTLARTGARAAESIAGLPGDIIGGGVNLLSAATGGRTPTSEQLTQKDIAKGVPEWAQLPTSKQARKVTKAVTGEALEPQSSGEENWDEIVGDAAAIFLGGSGGVAKKAAKSLGISTLGNLTKWGLESATGSPLIGGVGKLGATLLAGTLGTRKELNSLRKQSYEDAFSKLSDKKRFNFSPEAKSLDSTIKKIQRSSIPDKQEVINRLEEFKNITGKNGTAKVSEVIGIKQGWNEYLREKGKGLGSSAKRELQDAVGIVNSGISRFGKTDKEFWTPYIRGEELTAGLRDMDSVGQFIQKHPSLRKKMDNPFLGSIFKYGLGATTGGLISQYPVQTGSAVAGLYGIQQASKAFKLMAKSPLARQAYKDAVKDGLAGNVANFSRDLSRLERAYEKNADDLEGKLQLLD